ncbi:hypothetical protein A3A60_03360 [Candidatus Curtissbacteria bacterium RIFCSPLOWO2_01_FULL_42_26]|uniref:Glycosyl transferase family 1 n=1 Tax=Candidatus Curtissbacteria bacterium RIFCSPLOWO2_01_FULL_42_26 TaxID=1797729 RepID=A0A1F5I491_9BACT|nr:MAG: hypothetical protein A3A60_03360 [Candidatus Curtissbacteria bacterium RIFCSPLOWO2_01_FULL_42_26]
MKIGIDARFVGPEGTGLGTYTQNLIENLQKIDYKNQYSIFLRASNWQYLKITNNNFSKVLANIAWYSLAEQIKMPAIFTSQNLDLLHVPHFNMPILYKGKFIVTIHDLIHKHFNQNTTSTNNPLIYKLKRAAFAKVLNHAIKGSAKIITPSKFVKNDIVKNFKVVPSKITVTYEASEKEYLTDERSTMNNQRYILYVGNAYPHKNLNKLLDAMKILDTKYLIQNTKLILICPRDVFARRLTTAIESRNLEKNVELKDYLPAPELKKLFEKASAYVCPSLSEGFGIPGLNAMASGVPVICSNIPIFKEVYADSVHYFDPNDEGDIAQKINKVLKDKKLRDNLFKKEKAQVAKYSWLKMAQETLKVYEEVLSVTT